MGGVDAATGLSPPAATFSSPVEPPCATVMKTKARSNRSPIQRGGRPPTKGPLLLLLVGGVVGGVPLLLLLLLLLPALSLRLASSMVLVVCEVALLPLLISRGAEA